jgi:exonuclease VII small subunit
VKRYQFLEEALAEYEDAIEYYERAQTAWATHSSARSIVSSRSH